MQAYRTQEQTNSNLDKHETCAAQLTGNKNKIQPKEMDGQSSFNESTKVRVRATH